MNTIDLKKTLIETLVEKFDSGFKMAEEPQ